MPVMPVVVVTPVVMAVPVTIVANPAQAVVSPYHPAAMVRGIIRIVVIGRVEVPVKAMVPKREAAVAKAAAVENMRGAKSAAMEHGATAVETAAVKRRTPTMEAAASAAVKSASPAAVPSTMLSKHRLRQPTKRNHSGNHKNNSK